MKAHKLIKLLKKHKKYIQLSIDHNEFDNK